MPLAERPTSAIAIAAILLLKFTLPLLILRHPFQASWANYVLDTLDGDALVRTAEEWRSRAWASLEVYQVDRLEEQLKIMNQRLTALEQAR